MLALFFILSQGLSTHTADQPKRPPEVLALVDQARALPPEFRADTLLRLSDSPLIKETAWKQELIEEAFWSGVHAPLPYPQWADKRSDSVSDNAVRQNRLEALTLQTRAVQAMLAIDPQKALRLYEEVQTPTIPMLSCTIVFTPVVLDYYQSAVFVFENSFSPKQRKQGDYFSLPPAADFYPPITFAGAPWFRDDLCRKNLANAAPGPALLTRNKTSSYIPP